jgi:thiamine monophosphate kinase
MGLLEFADQLEIDRGASVSSGSTVSCDPTLKSQNPEIIGGIGNDAVVIRPKTGWDLVFTTDMLVEGRYFDLKTSDSFSLGAKTIVVNLSDCAAMGAKPLAAVVSLGLPKNVSPSWVTAFYEGMQGCGRTASGSTWWAGIPWGAATSR